MKNYSSIFEAGSLFSVNVFDVHAEYGLLGSLASKFIYTTFIMLLGVNVLAAEVLFEAKCRSDNENINLHIRDDAIASIVNPYAQQSACEYELEMIQGDYSLHEAGNYIEYELIGKSCYGGVWDKGSRSYRELYLHHHKHWGVDYELLATFTHKSDIYHCDISHYNVDKLRKLKARLKNIEY